ncbi:MAG: beta-lactamase family protein [Chloroflexi bacterium]|nr:beta-lactamase family protein [Chloroflexota bacterium]
MTQHDFRELDAFVVDAMARLNVPGVAVGLLIEGKAHTFGYGITSVENPLPVTGDTLFQIGSTTKTFTGTAVMRLVEAGKIDLDAPLRTYLPDFRLPDEEAAAIVTVRHLLTHTSGWAGDYFEDFGPGPDAVARYVASMATLPQLTPPGVFWSYNNANYWVAARVIEVVTGQLWEAAIRALVIEPLGMGRSFFFADDVLTHRFAVGHHVRDGRAVVARRWSFPRRRPSGSIISSAKDQLRYARFHLGDGSAPDGTRVLSPESLAFMRSPLCARDLGGMMQGLTWMLKTIDGTQIVQHGGATNGQMSAFLFVPERNFALTVLTNADKGAMLHRQMVAWALEQYLGLRETKPGVQTLPHERLGEYAGTYALPPTELNVALEDVIVSVEDDHLLARFNPRGGYPTKDSPQPPRSPTRLAFCGVDRVLALDDPAEDAPGEFLRDDAGRIRWLRYGTRIRPRRP